MKKIYCPKCKNEIWDIATNSKLNKCHNCGSAFDEGENMNNKQKLQNFISYVNDNKIIEHVQKQGTNDYYYCFNTDFIGTENKEYNILSDLVHDSGLDYDSAITMVATAIDIVDSYLSDCEELDEVYMDEADLTEYVDGQVPVYNYELLTFLRDNYPTVEEIADEMCLNEGKTDIIRMCQVAYYVSLERITMELLRAITEGDE